MSNFCSLKSLLYFIQSSCHQEAFFKTPIQTISQLIHFYLFVIGILILLTHYIFNFRHKLYQYSFLFLKLHLMQFSIKSAQCQELFMGAHFFQFAFI